MEWVIRFIAIWTILLILVDWKEFKINVWCGVFSMGLQLGVDSLFINKGLYQIKTPIINIFGSSIFFLLGPAFAAAVLLSQFHPKKRWLQIPYVVIFSFIYDFEELMLTIRKELIYNHWSIWISIIFNFILMTSLSWFSVVVLKRGVKNFES